MIHWLKWPEWPYDGKPEHKFLCDRCCQELGWKAKFAAKMAFGKPGSYFNWRNVLYQVARFVVPGMPQEKIYMTRQWNFRLLGRSIAITFFKDSDV